MDKERHLKEIKQFILYIIHKNLNIKTSEIIDKVMLSNTWEISEWEILEILDALKIAGQIK